MEARVSEVIQKQSSQPEQSCIDLVNLLINTCGLQDKLKVDHLNLKSEEILRQIETKFIPTQQNEYPLVSKKKEFKFFQQNQLHFWTRLANKLGDNLHDEVVVPFLLDWFKNLSALKERPIRHTTVFTAFVFAQALLEILTEQHTGIADQEGKVAAEKKKKNKARTKITEFEVQLNNLKKRAKTVSDFLNYVQTHVALERHRDLMPEVRREVVKFLSACLMQHPSLFQRDETHEVLKLLTADRSGEVRKAVVDLLIRLLEDIKDRSAEHRNALFTFLDDLVGRTAKLTGDFDTKVGISAIKVCTSLVQQDLLNNDEKHLISKLVLNENGEIRKAALQFVDQGILDESLIKNEDAHKNQSLLVNFVEFLDRLFDIQPNKNFETFSLVKQIIENYWGFASLFTDFSLFCELLLKMRHIDRVNTNHIYLIVQILLCCIKIAKRESDSAADKNKKKRVDPAVSKKIFEQCTNVVFSYLPELIKSQSFMDDVIVEFIKIPQFFDQEQVTSEGNEKRLMNLFSELNNLFKDTSNKFIIEETTRTYLKQLNQNHNLRDEVREQVESLARNSIDTLIEHLNSSRLNEKESFSALEVKLVRVIELTKAYEILEINTAVTLQVRIMDIISTSIYHKTYDAEICNMVSPLAIEQMFTYLQFFMNWKQQLAIKHVEDYLQQQTTFRKQFVELLLDTLDRLYFISRDTDPFVQEHQRSNMFEIETLHSSLIKILCETLIITSSNSTVNLVTFMKVDTKIFQLLDRYIRSLNIHESINDEAKKKDRLPTDRLVITSIVLSRIVIGCPDVTFSKLAHFFLSKFQLSTHNKIMEIVKDTYAYIKNSSETPNDKGKKAPTATDTNKEPQEDYKNLWLYFVQKTLKMGQITYMEDQLTQAEFVEVTKRIISHVSRFKDDQLDQLKTILLKIIDFAFQKRAKSKELYSDEVYNIKFLKVVNGLLVKAKVNKEMSQKLFDAFKAHVVSLDKALIENNDKTDYEIIKNTYNMLAKNADVKQRIDIGAIEQEATGEKGVKGAKGRQTNATTHTNDMADVPEQSKREVRQKKNRKYDDDFELEDDNMDDQDEGNSKNKI